MLDVLLDELKARGFYPVQTEDDKDGEVWFWSHDEWGEWWQTAEGGTRRRTHLLLDTVGQILGEESGWETPRRQQIDVREFPGAVRE